MRWRRVTTSQGIAVVTQTLSYVVGLAARRAVPEVSVTVEPPEQPAAAAREEPRVNLYLIQVLPDPHLRTSDLPTRSAEGALIARPMIPVNLRYFISFFGPTRSAHLLLGAVAVAFHSNAFLDPVTIEAAVADYPELVGSGLNEQAPPVRVMPGEISLEELSRFWSGFFQTAYTLSVVYEAGPVLLDASVVPPPPPRPPHRGAKLAAAPVIGAPTGAEHVGPVARLRRRGARR